jgi:hypothetical protein
MKKIVFFLVTFLSLNVIAQDIKVPSSLTVVESTYKMDGVDRNGYDIILQGDEKDILNAWIKYLGEKFDIKLKSKGSTANGEEIINAIWSDKQFAIKSGVVTDASGPHLRVWMLFGADILVTSSAYPSESANLKVVIKEFAKSYYVGIFQKQLDDQNKTVTTQGKEVTGLNEDKAKDEKAIAKAEAKMAKAEKKKADYTANIEKLKAKIVAADDEIRENKEFVESKRGNINKTATELEKEKEKLQSVTQDQEAIKAKIRAIQAL